MKTIKWGSKVYKIDIKVKETSTYFQRFSYWLLKGDLPNKVTILIELNTKLSEACAQYDKIQSEACAQYDKIKAEAWAQYDTKVTLICKEIIKKYKLDYMGEK